MPRLSIAGAPDHEHRRSPAAKAVAAMARDADLFLSHFEHRLALPTPPSWTDQEAHSARGFVGGVLEEPKYQTFRHDSLVGSFHPGHRAKWTAHELCHALVGFAYRSDASALFHALAAWLAELLPVTLWYFFDEAGVRRCADHQYGGPIFQRHCAACETAAGQGARRLDADDRKRIAEGRSFVDRELAALARSRRLGRPAGTLHATIDLASDGLAYAHAHGPRLRAPEMERFVAQFFAPHQGYHTSLEALEARGLEVCGAIVERKRAAPWRATRWDYAAQDVGYRLLALQSTSPAHASELDPLIDRLASRRTRAGLTGCIRDYQALWTSARPRSRAGLVAPDALFAVGYDLPEGLGRAQEQLAQGVASACPNGWAALGKRAAGYVERFAHADRPERAPLGRRFARWLAQEQESGVSDLMRLEAAITHVLPRDPLAVQLDPAEARGGELRLARGVEVVRLSYDVAELAPEKARRARPLREPRVLLVARAQGQDVDLIEVPAQLADVLERKGEGGAQRGELGLPRESIDELLEARWLVPVRYAV
jgi:hypothetical protein